MKTSATSGDAPLDKSELLRRLKNLASHPDKEVAHSAADDLLLAFINDKDVTKAFVNVKKWYA